MKILVAGDSFASAELAGERVTWFDNTTWEHWCDQQQFPRGRFKHPLDLAHHAAFTHFQSLYDTIIHKD